MHYKDKPEYAVGYKNKNNQLHNSHKTVEQLHYINHYYN